MTEPHPNPTPTNDDVVLAADGLPVRYPYLVSVRHGREVPARRDGRYFVCAYQTQLGLWWHRRDVEVLQYDPRRDFYREQRRVYLAAHPETADPPASPTPDTVTAATPDAPTATGPGWERVDATRTPRRPAPDTPPTAPPRRPGWGR